MKKKIGLLYGGRSVEHDVSLRSASNVMDNLDQDLFEVVPIGIDWNGNWFLTSGIEKEIGKGQPVALLLQAERPGLFLLDSQSRIDLEVIFPVLHGTDGEDGSIQGMFKALSLPVVGSGILGSSICLDKIMTKLILQSYAIPTSPFLAFSKDDAANWSFSTIVEKLGLPFMLKPVSLGSSVGVEKIKDEAGYQLALENCFKYDNEVLVEEFITGRELECAVLGNNDPEVAGPGEIVIKGNYDFYDFDAKYVDADGAEIIIPAQVDEATGKRIRKLAREAFLALRCSDYSRVDLFLTKDGKLFINEINTIPGFTNISMFPMLWQHEGMTYKALITRMITLSIERFESQGSVSTYFESGLN